MRTVSFSLLASTTAIALSAPVLAQGNTGSSNFGDIIVTAQKRAQNIQDVPISISALPTDYLEKREISSIESLSGLSPNLKVERASNSLSSSVIAIRGGVQSNPQLYFEPSVGLYMDGVYIAKAQGSVFDVADVERIEVLRGPQGTLYGRNAVAGAVNIVMKKPSGILGGRIEGSYGNYNTKRLRGTLDLPEFGIFSVKLSGLLNQHDGFYKVVGNSHTDSASSLNSKSGVVQVRAQPSDALTVDYVFDISDIKTQTGGVLAVNGSGPLVPYLRPGKRPKTLYFDAPNFENTRNWGHALTVELDAGDIGTFKSISAIRKQKAPQALEMDGTPLDFGSTHRISSRYQQISQELQLTGEAGPVNYVLGGYYFNDKGTVRAHQRFYGGLFETYPDYSFKTEAIAGYAQVDVAVTDTLTLTGGLRYTHEKKQIARQLLQIVGPNQIPVIDLDFADTPPAKFNKLSPAATINWEVVPDVNFYARYAQGYRSGGFNGTANTTADVQQIFQPEIQDTYEIGLKSRLLDNRLILNAALFQNDMKDLQLTVFQPGLSASTLLANAGKARMRGFEIDATAYPTDRLMFQASLGYLEPKYKEYIDNGVNVADNRTFQHAPKYTFSTSFDWTAVEADFGKINLIVDYTLVSKYYSSATATPRPTSPTETPARLVQSPGREMLGARAVLSEIPLGGTALGSFSIWGKNLLNEKDPNFFIDFGAGFSNMIIAYFPDPRTYGATFSISF